MQQCQSWCGGLPNCVPYASLVSMDVGSLLPYAQIALSILLVVAILLQQTGAGLGGAFGGGDNFGATYHTRRGAEKVLFYASIVLGVLFALSAFVALLV